MPLSNARITYEPNRDDGPLSITFKDKEEAVFFAEAILHEVRTIENDGLSVSECALITISFREEGNRKDQKRFGEHSKDRITTYSNVGGEEANFIVISTGA